MKSLFARFAKDESGATAIEYGLLATLIGIAIIAGASALGTQLSATFTGDRHQARRLHAVVLAKSRKLPRGFGPRGLPRTRLWRGSVRHLVARFVRDRSAATAIEYGLIAMLDQPRHHRRRHRGRITDWQHAAGRGRQNRRSPN